MKRHLILLPLLVATTISNVEANDSLRDTANRLFGVIQAPEEALLESEKVKLGQHLFWDERVSVNGKVACSSCHKAEDWSSDKREYSPDANNMMTSRHSQPIFNAVGQIGLRWVADRRDAQTQAQGSLTGSLGFSNHDEVVAKLKELDYEEWFKKAFPDSSTPTSVENYGQAIAAYESTLKTPSAFDRYLQGDDSALTVSQKNGLDLFVSTGCASCHNGLRLGGEMMQKFGVFGNYWEYTGSKTIDKGKSVKTGKLADEYVFRVPILRNIVKTAPYFHDGSVSELPEAVRIMAEVQLNKSLSEREIAEIIEFLDSLTGKIPQNYTSP
ncbi:cytochrome-c peroxidase [Alteromonas macleodii]|uniref:cytochrome-c peroxidase n=1 Tax=Alteromonas macleodii TaxID=28108 RepID=UPI00207684F4|nr:cytochrome c peroxidase [Alteromonas macleodii]USI26460.1 c-type cytochrome [Alteromonas macleodii]